MRGGPIAFACVAPLVAAAAFLPLAACKKPLPGTPPGTRLLEWRRGPTSWTTGVSLGDDIGPAQVTTKDVTFTPDDERRSAGPAVFTVRVERGDTRVVPNDAGDRPAETLSAPRAIDITARDAGKWRASAKCEVKLSYPMASTAPRAVTLAERCRIALEGPRGEPAGVVLTVLGDGRLDTMGIFGTTTTSP